MNFSDGPVSCKRGVKNVETAVAPSATRRAAQSRIASISDEPPNLDFERLVLEFVKRVEQPQIARSSAVIGHLGICPCIQRLNDGKNVLGSALINQINCAFILEHRMYRM